MSIPKTIRAYPKMPGNYAQRLTSGARDSAGHYWPAGTVGQPRCSGYDNTVNKSYCDLTIEGERRRFHEEG